MKLTATIASKMSSPGHRLDASYHASLGVKSLRFLEEWGQISQKPQDSQKLLREERYLYGENRLEVLTGVCSAGGVYIPSRFKRIFVEDQEHGAPYITGSSILEVDPLRGAKHLSYRFTSSMKELALSKRMILVTCSGTIGNAVYVNSNFKNGVGSPDLLRIVADPEKILPGYLYAFISSKLGSSLIGQKTYGAVVQHIEAHHLYDLYIPRLPSSIEKNIHDLIEESSQHRERANQELERVQKRFLLDVLDLNEDDLRWENGGEHAFATGTAVLSMKHYRLDGFHYVGYVQEAETYLKDTTPLGELISPYQPPIFKRPYTDETGIPFLSGMDLYNAYPKPRLYISRKMPNLNKYIVKAGTILVQNVGQRYGLFGRPTILQKHLDNASVTQHLMRVYPNNPNDKGFVYIWLSTEIGRRLLLKQSFGTSMGVLFEHSFSEMPVPKCSAELRHSFEPEIQTICDYRDKANELEDEAQAILLNALGWDGT
jgi:type I restriction enzyme, S subunit